MKTMKRHNQKRKPDIDKAVRAYLEADAALLGKMGLKKKLIISFPSRFNRPPTLISRLGLFLLKSQGGLLDTEFSETN